MTDVAKLRELLERVENASGPDSEIDAELAIIFGDVRLRLYDGRFALFESGTPGVKQWAFASGLGGHSEAVKCFSTLLGLKSYTSSIDAATALCERVLPGMALCVIVECAEDLGFIGNRVDLLPLKICAAILRAKIAELENGNDA